MFDVLVVGAGPAGSVLAGRLASEGLRVQVIDKARFPRHKVCAGALSRKTMDLLGADLAPVIEERLTGSFLTYQNRGTIRRDDDRVVGCTVQRARLDQLLLDEAVAAGAGFVPGCTFQGVAREGARLRVATSRGAYEARVVAGADGVYSRVRRQHFGRRVVDYRPAMEARIWVPEEARALFAGSTLFDFGGTPRGYGWIFPKEDHLNVGVYSAFASRDLRRHLTEFIARYRCLADHRRIEIEGHCIPVRNRQGAYEKDGVLLVGDAAGFAELVFGEGIYYAVRSAGLAADAIVAHLGDGGPLGYQELLERHLLPDIRYSALNAQLLFRVPRFGYHRMVRSRFVNDYYSRFIFGEIDQRECFYRTLLTAPYWLFSEKYPDHAIEL